MLGMTDIARSEKYNVLAEAVAVINGLRSRNSELRNEKVSVFIDGVAPFLSSKFAERTARRIGKPHERVAARLPDSAKCSFTHNFPFSRE